jgi:glucose-6-phosphate 1-dehydrogenase
MRTNLVDKQCQGLGGAKPDPCLMVIFGASGDLTRRLLMPSLFELALKGLLPEHFAVLGFSLEQWSDDDFRRQMRGYLEQGDDFDADAWRGFAGRLHYLPGDFTSKEDFRRLGERIARLEEELGLPDNLYFHLATPPAFFGRVAENLDRAALARPERASGSGWRRIVIEKPFGADRTSARALHDELQTVFRENQIYRMDHFLGKETVQNMLVFRFANPSFEPIWNHRFIDHVQITVAEDIGIGTRGAFYERTGVVRDMVQNHLLQLLCLTAVEPPTGYQEQSLRDETVKVLRAINPPGPKECVFGQYGPGAVHGQEVVGYRDEADVAPDSAMPTFAAIKLKVDNWRWVGVPFYLRTGKRLAAKSSEVSVHFKPTAYPMFAVASGRPLYKNVLTFRLQPEEGILQTFVAKQPGAEICLTPVTSRFLYADAFGVTSPPRAYAWLILDVMEGEQTLFAREDWIEQAWTIVDPIVQRLENHPLEDQPNYVAGSWGPTAASALLERDRRLWDTPTTSG